MCRKHQVRVWRDSQTAKTWAPIKTWASQPLTLHVLAVLTARSIELNGGHVYLIIAHVCLALLLNYLRYILMCTHFVLTHFFFFFFFMLVKWREKFVFFCSICYRRKFILIARTAAEKRRSWKRLRNVEINNVMARAKSHWNCLIFRIMFMWYDQNDCGLF